MSASSASPTVRTPTNVVVTTVPYLIGRAVRLRDLVAHDELLDETAEEPVPSA